MCDAAATMALTGSSHCRCRGAIKQPVSNRSTLTAWHLAAAHLGMHSKRQHVALLLQLCTQWGRRVSAGNCDGGQQHLTGRAAADHRATQGPTAVCVPTHCNHLDTTRLPDRAVHPPETPAPHACWHPAPAEQPTLLRWTPCTPAGRAAGKRCEAACMSTPSRTHLAPKRSRLLHEGRQLLLQQLLIRCQATASTAACAGAVAGRCGRCWRAVACALAIGDGMCCAVCSCRAPFASQGCLHERAGRHGSVGAKPPASFCSAGKLLTSSPQSAAAAL